MGEDGQHDFYQSTPEACVGPKEVIRGEGRVAEPKPLRRQSASEIACQSKGLEVVVGARVKVVRRSGVRIHHLREAKAEEVQVRRRSCHPL